MEADISILGYVLYEKEERRASSSKGKIVRSFFDASYEFFSNEARFRYLLRYLDEIFQFWDTFLYEKK